MHPIERLRYVARASGVPQAILVREAAGALASFTHDPQALVTACRRMLSRQPGSGPLVWLASQVLTAAEPLDVLRRCLDQLDGDPTPRELAAAIDDDATVLVLGWPAVVADALRSRGDLRVLVVDVADEGVGFVQRLWDADVDAADVPVAGLGAAAATADLVLVESIAIGPRSCLAVAGSHAAAAVATAGDNPVWVVGGVGRMLPGPLWDVLEARLDGREDPPWELDDERVPLHVASCIVGVDGVLPVAEALQRVHCPVAPELLRADH